MINLVVTQTAQRKPISIGSYVPSTFLQPVHRYEGLQAIVSVKLNLSGVDKRSGNTIPMNINECLIYQMNPGIYNTLNAMEKRGQV